MNKVFYNVTFDFKLFFDQNLYSAINWLIISSLDFGFFEGRESQVLFSPTLDCAPLTGILNKKLSGTETTDWQSFDTLNVRPKVLAGQLSRL